MPVPPRRDFQGLARRRQQAARLFAAGKLILASIARELKVSRQSVTRWYREWQHGGASALRGAGRAGRYATRRAVEAPSRPATARQRGDRLLEAPSMPLAGIGEPSESVEEACGPKGMASARWVLDPTTASTRE